MKRIILLFSLTLIAGFVYAQIPLGFKAGINTNTIVVREAVDGYNDSDADVSFHLGVFTKLKLSDKLIFIPEMQFIQKQSGYSSGDFRLSYLELPLLISYQPIQLLNIEVGPSVGLNVGSNLYVDLYKKADCGVVGGLRFNLTPKWSVVGRYHYGLTPIEKLQLTSGPPGPPSPDKVKFYNQTLQFSVAYYLK